MDFRFSPSRSNAGLLVSRAIFALMLAYSAILLQAQQPGNTASVRSEIARLENRWLNAIETSDISALDSVLADDFIRPAPAAGHFITKSQLLAYYKARKPSASGVKRIENLQVNVYGTTAIARGNVVKTDAAGREASRNLFTDVFVLRDDRWQAVSAQENDVKVR